MPDWNELKVGDLQAKWLVALKKSQLFNSKEWMYILGSLQRNIERMEELLRPPNFNRWTPEQVGQLHKEINELRALFIKARIAAEEAQRQEKQETLSEYKKVFGNEQDKEIKEETGESKTATARGSEDAGAS